MKTMQKFVITGVLAACAAFDLSAMPTKKDLPKDGAGDVDVKAILEAVSKLDNGNEKYRTVVGMLFPGWTVENKDIGDDFGGFRAGHRGVSNVFVTHPPTREKPVVISRTVKLSDKFPCLFLSVSSFNAVVTACWPYALMVMKQCHFGPY